MKSVSGSSRAKVRLQTWIFRSFRLCLQTESVTITWNFAQPEGSGEAINAGNLSAETFRAIRNRRIDYGFF